MQGAENCGHDEDMEVVVETQPYESQLEQGCGECGSESDTPDM